MYFRNKHYCTTRNESNNFSPASSNIVRDPEYLYLRLFLILFNGKCWPDSCYSKSSILVLAKASGIRTEGVQYVLQCISMYVLD